jgi:hypothetical protein
MNYLVSTPELRILATADALPSAQLLPKKGGTVLCVDIKGKKHFLQTKRHKMRVFKTTDTAISYCANLGIQNLLIDLSEWGH